MNDQNYHIKDEIEKHLWADYIIIQTPMYWMQTSSIFKKHMLSVTKEAFNNPNQTFFEGKTVDDVYFPLHLNFKFFDMEALSTFSAHDVLKNPQIEEDFTSFKEHINYHF